ncbi:PTS system, lactose/cellobiose family IIC component [Desulfuromusa kysingii]|uniref:PTS system, lactose/cellobiose family IIC component n=1 Tax=Desulfuromusa kysingii TaxID=37625 RepID=A0A1H4DSW3_9BACT|nr:EAL domain-containing protein [Desulfuromusa kysingii]SEA75844.1 PTS system, lactose/cellobiose family IIC component [Desulfuromusa kysingii]
MTLRAIQRGLIFPLPLIVAGAMSLCLLHFPYLTLQNFLTELFGVAWRSVLETIVQGSFGVASLAVVCGVALNLALLLNDSDRQGFVSPGMTTMVALSCYIIIVGSPNLWTSQFSLGSGLFLAVVSSVIASRIFLWLASIKSLRFSFSIIGRDPSTFQILSLMPAGILTIFVCAVGQVTFESVFPEGDLITGFIQGYLFAQPIGDLGLGLLFVGLSQIFWFFGIHGPNMLFPLIEEKLNLSMLENAHDILNHVDPSHILTKEFLDAFAFMGGSGCTLSLILAVYLKGTDPGNRRLCYLALIPALCNVNEPLLFGIPLIFNPLYFIPFLLVPLINIVTAYLATTLDLVPNVSQSVHWTTPAFISGYISTGSIAGTMLQVVNLVIGTFVYCPFILLAEKTHKKQLHRSVKTLAAYSEEVIPGPDGKKCLSRPGIEGYLARSLADDLIRALDEKKQLFLVYQPQINTLDNQVAGVEALLRWQHPVYGLIPPPLTVALAEDSGVIDDLGTFVLKSACTTFKVWQPSVRKDFRISVNLSGKELNNFNLVKQVANTLKATGVPAHYLELEITETVAVTPNEAIFDTLFALRSMGAHVAIDDFGMGHTSLRYLKAFPIDTVKLDRSLTEETEDKVNDHIVGSIMNLGENMHLRTIVEGVETVEQCERFKKMGCSLFQGYYFSPPLSSELCFNFMMSYHQGETLRDESLLTALSINKSDFDEDPVVNAQAC